MEERFKRGDMILMYRIMKEDLNIKRELLFPEVRQLYTRGHHLKVQLGKPANLDVRRHFFNQRVIVPWNEMPQTMVNSPSVDSFKSAYDKWCGKVSN